VEVPSGKQTTESKRVLEPLERISEVLFGLIIVLTFTSTINLAETSRGEVHGILIKAIGCTLAWAIIDALFYLVGCLSKRGRSRVLLRRLHVAADAEEARRTIAEALPPLIASHLQLEAFESLRQKLTHLPEEPFRLRPTKHDWWGALAVLSLACASIFPVMIPFIFMSDARLALQISHGIAIVLLFVTGYALGLDTSERPLRVALSMVVLGSAMIGVALVLGG